MKRILTNNITDPNTRQPFTSDSIEHQKEALIENSIAMTEGMIHSPFNVTVLTGVFTVDTGATIDYEILFEGYAYFNGELFRTIASTATTDASNTAYFEIDTTFRAGDPRTFSDGQQFNIHEIRRIKLVTVANPGTSDSPAADALNLVTNASFVALEPGAPRIAQHTLNIGVWNMDASSSVNVSLAGLPINTADIRAIDAMILHDTDGSIKPLTSLSNLAGDLAGSIANVTSGGLLTLNRSTGGLFDTADYDDAVMNRGYVTIQYLPTLEI